MAGGVSGGGPWEQLPDAVRIRLAEIAATAVGGLAEAEVPPSLRRTARFTPAKRARLGGPALVGELASCAAFRTAVVGWWEQHRPGELDPTAGDPVAAAAAALLCADIEVATEAVRAATRRGEVAELRAERDTALARADKLTAELERLRGELGEAREATRSAVEERAAELLALRRRVGEQGATVRAALADRDAAERAVEGIRAELRDAVDAAHVDRDRERDRADAERARADHAAGEVAAARQAAREARQADEVRLSLLLDTLGAAVAGLRHELAVGGTGPRPADLVAGARPAREGGVATTLAELDALLSVPATHLVVDGYNVSKTGYPDLTLADQRARLVGRLGALGARTGVEVTVVFDGAGVVAAPARGSRGVRVLFSDPGVPADDVIRSLVAAEPRGRPVLVVTSDRAVADSVRATGAHTLASALLVDRLGRA